MTELEKNKLLKQMIENNEKTKQKLIDISKRLEQIKVKGIELIGGRHE